MTNDVVCQSFVQLDDAAFDGINKRIEAVGLVMVVVSVAFLDSLVQLRVKLRMPHDMTDHHIALLKHDRTIFVEQTLFDNAQEILHTLLTETHDSFRIPCSANLLASMTAHERAICVKVFMSFSKELHNSSYP